MSIEGIPEGWELVRVGSVKPGEIRVDSDGKPVEWNSSFESIASNYVIIRKIEKPKRYRPFANAAEYASRRDGFSVDWKNNTIAPGFHAVVSANEPFLWVAFGTDITRFEWGQAFEKLEFRHVNGSTSPFGVEVAE